MWWRWKVALYLRAHMEVKSGYVCEKQALEGVAWRGTICMNSKYLLSLYFLCIVQSGSKANTHSFHCYLKQTAKMCRIVEREKWR